MKNTIFSLVLMIIAGFTFSSCKIEKVKNAGSVETRQYYAKNFTKIRLEYPGKVIFIPSDTFSVSVKATKYAHERMIVTTDGGVVRITRPRKKDNVIFVGDGFISNDLLDNVVITIKAPTLSDVSIAGCGEFECKDTLKSTNLELSVAGSGEMDIKYIKANSVSASISGSGEIDAGLVHVPKSDLQITGSGDIDINFFSCGFVNAEIAGSGVMELKGNVERFTKYISGSGDIDTYKLNIKDVKANYLGE